MTKRTLIISVIAVVITLTAGALQGAAPTEKPRKLIRIGSLKTIESNQEFDRNVRLLQAQRARAVELAKALETVQAEEAKEGLQKELDAMMAKLNENKLSVTHLMKNLTRVVTQFLIQKEQGKKNQKWRKAQNYQLRLIEK